MGTFRTAVSILAVLTAASFPAHAVSFTNISGVLTDDPAEGEVDGGTVGADIDAIGAISTTVVPAPAAAWLLLTGVGGLARRYWRRHR